MGELSERWKGNITLPNASIRLCSFVCRHDAIFLKNKEYKKCSPEDGDHGHITATLRRGSCLSYTIDRKVED
jgi:hypothetical protein